MKEKNIKFLGEGNKEYTISPIEKVFCEKYIEFRGNGTEAILAAGFKTKNRKSASAMASRRLLKPRIAQFLKSILSGNVSMSNDTEKVMKHLAFLITQNKSFSIKLRAIRLYNKLARRYPGQINHNK
ncbi:unnamed protein product [marine sediment metagenome]|uniref:Terminase small subunit n=1 Tax=marine sediment metagenome TaxID=412755 RepID=X1GQT3_9ZZZZ